MVSSRNTPDEWTIPGGGLEPNEEPRDTAAREAMEEVRVVNITSCLSTITY
jgi:8-oxo-dGTP pyrophosphatase MutT (NUDIX family)